MYGQAIASAMAANCSHSVLIWAYAGASLKVTCSIGLMLSGLTPLWTNKVFRSATECVFQKLAQFGGPDFDIVESRRGRRTHVRLKIGLHGGRAVE